MTTASPRSNVAALQKTHKLKKRSRTASPCTARGVSLPLPTCNMKLDFTEPCEKIRALGICPDFTDAQTRAWYDANPDLFTRYAGDSFPYEEVKQIIEKRMREEVYDSLVQDLLRGPADRP